MLRANNSETILSTDWTAVYYGMCGVPTSGCTLECWHTQTNKQVSLNHILSAIRIETFKRSKTRDGFLLTQKEKTNNVPPTPFTTVTDTLYLHQSPLQFVFLLVFSQSIATPSRSSPSPSPSPSSFRFPQTPLTSR